MMKTKTRKFALLFTLLLFVVSLAFSVTTLFRVKAEEPLADVSVEIKDHADLVKTTDNNIYGKENVTAVGWTGWGGFAKELTFSETKDLSAIQNSGKGALSFWLYIPDQNVLGMYTSKTADKPWNFDISSNATYSDNYKWTFTIHGTDFANARIGWQRIVIPFSAVAASDKSAMDWSAVKSARINTTGFGLSSGYTGKVADVSFTTTNLTKATLTGDPVTTFAYSNVSNTMPDKTYEIDGETGTAYGRPGEGGFASYHTLDKAYSVQKTDTSAFSVWVKLGKESDKKALNAYNIDITSTYTGSTGWNDDRKYTFDLTKGAFAMCTVGEWSHVIIPLEKANEKHSIDWNALTCIRLNVDGGNPFFGLIAKMEIIQTNYTETTVVGYVPSTPDPTPDPDPDPTPDPTVPVDENGIVFPVASAEDMASHTTATLSAIMQLDKDTTAQYIYANMPASAPNWGSWDKNVKLLEFDKPYDVSAISTNQKGAFVFWLYVQNEATINGVKTNNLNMNISAIPTDNPNHFSDSHKWQYNMRNLADQLMVGWNQIVIPVSSFGKGDSGKGPLDNKVQTVRFVYNAGFVKGQADFAFADFGVFLREETEPTVLNRKTQMTKPEDVAFGVSNAADLTADNELLSGKTAYSAIGKNWTGAKTQLITFDKAYDLGDHDFYGKNVLSFGIYFADEETLEAHRAIKDKYFVTLGSGDSFNAANGYQFDIAALFADCSVGWNTFSLPVATADNKGEIDWENVKFLQISWDKAFGEGECEVAFADFKLLVLDETERSVANDSQITLGVTGYDDLGFAEMKRGNKKVNAYSTVGKNWGRLNEKKFTLAKSYDASNFQTNGAFTFWFYIDSNATLEAHKAVTGNWFVTLYSETYKGNSKLTFEIHSVFKDCIVGWNKLVLPFSTATDSSFDFGKVSFFSVNQDKATPIEQFKNDIAFTQFAIIATTETEMKVVETVSNIEEGLEPIEEKVIIACNETNPLQFMGNPVDLADHRYESGCVYITASNPSFVADFTCGKTDLRKNTLIFGFWFYIDDLSIFLEDGSLKNGINGEIELSSTSADDQNEIKWTIDQWGIENCKKGWNWITLKGEDGSFTGGEPDFDALCHFRLYILGIKGSMLKIDRITIGASEKLLSEPDWEKEKYGSSGGFQGPNAVKGEGGTQIKVDFTNGAEDFTTKVTEIVKDTITVTEEGCSSALTVIPIAFTVLAGATAIVILAVRQKKNREK